MADDEQRKSHHAGVSLPGQATEEAIAEVGTNAGKSLVKGFAKLSDAALGPWIASQEAKATAAKLAIETQAKIEAEQTVVNARRKYELEEIEHRALLDRRAQRITIEFKREQENFESIEQKSIEFTESDPDSGASQEIEDDWIFRWADFAQKVSDGKVQDLWARAANSAVIKGNTPLSAQALQTLSLFDNRATTDFQKFAFVVSQLGFLPPVDVPHDTDPQNIDVAALMDLGVIQRSTSRGPYKFATFIIESGAAQLEGMSLFKDRWGFTKRGADIANAVFRGSQFNPGDHLIDLYLQILVQREIRNNQSVSIFLLNEASKAWPKAFHLALPGAIAADNKWQSDNRYVNASPQLKRLLDWAGQHYRVQPS